MVDHNLGQVFIILAISNNKTVLTELIAVIWKFSNIDKKKSDFLSRSMSSQTVRQIENKPP